MKPGAPMAERGREQRQFWYVGDSDASARLVTGLSTHQPEAWWVPAVGYTLWLGEHIFDSQAEAVSAALMDARMARDKAALRVARLEDAIREVGADG